MSNIDPIILVFFIYGLAFFAMGLAIAFDSGGRIIEEDMRRRMLILAAFGLIHGSHEWYEMFIIIAEGYTSFQVTF